MNLTRDRRDIDKLVSLFFDRHLANLSPTDSSIAVKRAGSSWRDAEVDTYFVTRHTSELNVEDFEFSWAHADTVLRRLESSGYGSGLKRDMLFDLASLHKELKTRHVGAGELSDDIYVMF